MVAPDTGGPDEIGPVPGSRGEQRWPAAIAVFAALFLPLLLVTDFAGNLRVVLTGTGVVLLVATIISDPGRIDRHSRRNRALSLGLMLVLAATASSSTVRLIVELLDGAPELDDPNTLLAAGAVIWLENGLVFSLWFWEIDGGGPAARYHRVRSHPDFAFPQQMDPELAPAHWRPQYHDYLYLSLTNALAFSPTDAMPLTPKAKLSMGVQSLLSVALLSLVIANAVNVIGAA